MFDRTLIFFLLTIYVNISDEVLYINQTVTNLVATNNTNATHQIDKSSICTTEICAKESAVILSYLNQNTDPCVDFYEFACGKYLLETNVTDDKASGTLFSKLQSKVSEQLVETLTEQSQPDESRAIQLAKQLTKTCMNETKLNEQGIAPMVELLERYGGWSVVEGDKWNSNNWSWIEVQKKMYGDGFTDNLILDISFGPYFKNSSMNVLNIDRPNFGVPDVYLLQGLEHPRVKAYYNFMVDVAIIFGATKNNSERELIDVIQFETELVKISLSAEESRNFSTLLNEFNIETLQQTFPYLNWLDYINWNLNNNVTLDKNDPIIIGDKNYVYQLGAVLQKTSNKTISNYFAWNAVKSSSRFLNDVLHKRGEKYLFDITGIKKSKPRIIDCVERTQISMPIAVAATYIRKYFNEDSKNAINIMINSIHKEFVRMLERTPWMDSVTRIAAIEKAKAMNFFIGCPNELMENAKLDEYYQNLELQDSLLHSMLRIRKFNKVREINEFRQPIERGDWRRLSLEATMVNAFYSPQLNIVKLTAGILQDRFFSDHRPSYLNYGTIGWVVGHEVTHGFDDFGRQFDLNGSVANWWQEDTSKEFSSRAKCFLDKLDGSNSLGENIADVGGIKAAYGAYQRFVHQNASEPLLPGLNYTQNQLFWISAAQTYCTVSQSKLNTKQYILSNHSPANSRVFSAFSSSSNFSNDFSCAPKSPYNPENKCEIW